MGSRPSVAELLERHVAQQDGDPGLWPSWISEATRTCLTHEATELDPLPDLRTLRLALAGPLVGPQALADGIRVPGLGARYLRRLRVAARRWMRFRAPTDTQNPAAVLLGLADQPGAELGAVVRHFAVRSKALRRIAIVRGPAADLRTAAHARAAQRRRGEVLAAWPDWLERDGDLPVERGRDYRFVQVTDLPHREVLDDPDLRRWLRTAAALWWTDVPAVITLTDPHGHFALLPLDHNRAALNGDRTRSVWVSDRPAVERER